VTGRRAPARNPRPDASGHGARPASGNGSSWRGFVASVAVVLVVVVCARLGFWQLDRLEQRRAENVVLMAALAEPAIVLDAGTAAEIAADPDSFRFRRVIIRGEIPSASDVVLRGRSLEGRPGVHLLSPLVVDGADAVVLVNRGWAASPDGATLDPRNYPAPATAEIEGIVHPFPSAEGRGVPIEREVDGFPVFSLSRLDVTALRTRAPAPLLPFWIQQLPDPGAVDAVAPVPLAMPHPDEGNHLSYAVQWFGFAAIFLVGLGVMVARRGRSTGIAHDG
jgi:surfeit locus 1 family protein